MNTSEHTCLLFFCISLAMYMYLTRYVYVSWSSLMSRDPVMNTSESIFFLFFSISLAMYLYSALIECSCYVKISGHLV